MLARTVDTVIAVMFVKARSREYDEIIIGPFCPLWRETNTKQTVIINFPGKLGTMDLQNIFIKTVSSSSRSTVATLVGLGTPICNSHATSAGLVWPRDPS